MLFYKKREYLSIKEYYNFNNNGGFHIWMRLINGFLTGFLIVID